MNRRTFLTTLGTAAVAASFTRPSFAALGLSESQPEGIAQIIARSARNGRPHILLRSSWQSIDTGDVAHTPGALRLIERHLPDSDVTLWPQPGRFSDRTRAMLLRIFPRLRIAEGDIDREGRPTTKLLEEAWNADFFLHSSASSLVGRAHLAAWRKATNRPYGIYSITVDPVSFFTGGQNIEGDTLDALAKEVASPEVRRLDPELLALFNGASFLYCRDTLSLGYLRSQGVKAAVLGFGPDTVFSWDIQNSRAADAYLATAQLEAGKFLGIVPRLRYTPYHLEYKFEPTPGDLKKKAVSDRWVDVDGGKIGEAITHWVRETGNKVLIMPEFPYEMQVAERWAASLPEDVRKSVVRRDTFWSPDEQSGVMARARAVISCECHSPMLALAHGVPTLYLRQPTDTIKGQMWRDLDFGDWFAEIDQITGAEIWSRIRSMHENHAASVNRAYAFMARARAMQDRLWS